MVSLDWWGTGYGKLRRSLGIGSCRGSARQERLLTGCPSWNLRFRRERPPATPQPGRPKRGQQGQRLPRETHRSERRKRCWPHRRWLQRRLQQHVRSGDRSGAGPLGWIYKQHKQSSLAPCDGRKKARGTLSCAGLWGVVDSNQLDVGQKKVYQDMAMTICVTIKQSKFMGSANYSNRAAECSDEFLRQNSNTPPVFSLRRLMSAR